MHKDIYDSPCFDLETLMQALNKCSDLNAGVKFRPGTVLLFLLKRELGHYFKAYGSSLQLHALTVARVVSYSSGQRTCQYANGNPQKRHTHGIGLLHVPNVVMYCVLMSGRRGKFTTEKKRKKTMKTRPFFLHDMSRVVLVC